MYLFNPFPQDNFDSPLHDDEKTLLALVGVLEDILDVDNVSATTGPPVQVDLTTGFHVVFQNLCRSYRVDGSLLGNNFFLSFIYLRKPNDLCLVRFQGLDDSLIRFTIIVWADFSFKAHIGIPLMFLYFSDARNKYKVPGAIKIVPNTTKYCRVKHDQTFAIPREYK